MQTKSSTYYYASDHLGSSSVLTTQTGSYHERIEYLPYGETWVEDCASTGSATGSISGYSTPYKFTGKELDKETGLYYFGARYYDARVSRWISTDPAIEKYLPSKDKLKVKGEDLKHKGLKDKAYKDYPNMDFEKYKEIEGMGGVYNPINIDMYQYGWQNPITHYDPDGKKVLMLFIGAGGGFGISFEGSAGYLIQYGKGVEFKIYKVMAANKAAGREVMFGVLLTAYPTNINTVEDLKNASFVNFVARVGGGLFAPILGIGIANVNNELSISVTGGGGFVRGVSFSIPEEYKKDNEPKELDLNSKEAKFIKNLFKTLFPFEKVK
ncbi:MAG: RHS repeat-associated core domain-containing protein [Spirochaetota bacterium]